MILEPSGFTWANADLTGYGLSVAAARYLPWRTLVLVVPFLVILIAAGVSTAVVLLVAAGGVAIAVRERLSNRDYLTSTSLVRERGLLRGRRTEIPLELIDDVRVLPAGASALMGCGDLEVLSHGRCWTYTGIADPESKAKQILRARDAARSRASMEARS